MVRDPESAVHDPANGVPCQHFSEVVMHVLPSHDPIGPPRFLALFGSGEHARVVAEAAIAAGWTIAGTIGDAPAGESPHIPHLGEEHDLPAIRAGYPDLQFIIAIGNRPACQAIAARLDPLAWATVVHPTAWCSPSARLAGGVFVGPNAVVHTRCTIGRHAIIGAGTVIDHDATVAEFALTGPRVVVGSSTRIGAVVTIGIGVSIGDHLTVGDLAVIGTGAIITESLAPLAMVGTGLESRGEDSDQCRQNIAKAHIHQPGSH